jgi:hypothetical protein
LGQPFLGTLLVNLENMRSTRKKHHEIKYANARSKYDFDLAFVITILLTLENSVFIPKGTSETRETLGDMIY